MAGSRQPDLIWCSGSSRRYTEIAVAAGFRYGARLPDTVYPEIAPLYFADQDWRRPAREAYLAAVRRWRPALATALDWEREEQLPEVLAWAEDLAALVQVVIVIPKVFGGIARLPHAVGGRPVRLGYSAATSYGGTGVPMWDFVAWPHGVHVLGGSPQRQLRLARYLDVRSVDGNVARRMANAHCAYWVPGSATGCANRWWPHLQGTGAGGWGHDAPYEAFRRSCTNILAAWEGGR